MTRRHVIILYRRFGTTYRSHFKELVTLEDGTDTLSQNVGKVTTRRRLTSRNSADLTIAAED
jgi:hypothetical protein